MLFTKYCLHIYQTTTTTTNHFTILCDGNETLITGTHCLGFGFSKLNSISELNRVFCEEYISKTKGSDQKITTFFFVKPFWSSFFRFKTQYFPRKVFSKHFAFLTELRRKKKRTLENPQPQVLWPSKVLRLHSFSVNWKCSDPGNWYIEQIKFAVEFCIFWKIIFIKFGYEIFSQKTHKEGKSTKMLAPIYLIAHSGTK